MRHLCLQLHMHVLKLMSICYYYNSGVRIVAAVVTLAAMLSANINIHKPFIKVLWLSSLLNATLLENDNEYLVYVKHKIMHSWKK